MAPHSFSPAKRTCPLYFGTIHGKLTFDDLYEPKDDRDREAGSVMD